MSPLKRVEAHLEAYCCCDFSRCRHRGETLCCTSSLSNTTLLPFDAVWSRPSVGSDTFWLEIWSWKQQIISLKFVTRDNRLDFFFLFTCLGFEEPLLSLCMTTEGHMRSSSDDQFKACDERILLWCFKVQTHWWPPHLPLKLFSWQRVISVEHQVQTHLQLDRGVVVFFSVSKEKEQQSMFF